MKCHYEKIKGVGKVLIPGCMAVAVSNDIERCTCHSTTYESFERKRYNVEVKRIITKLEKENEYYRKLLERNEIEL